MDKKGMSHLLLAGSALMAAGGTAQAQTPAPPLPPPGTAAGTEIRNFAAATYTINGVAQNATSNTAIFRVDRKVNLTLIRDQAAATEVTRGQTDAVTTFRLTNLTNGTQDFLLDADQVVSAGILTGNDDFDVTRVRVFVDGNNNGTYEEASDRATFVDELAANGSIAVFIVADVSDSATANLAFASLNATVAAGGATGTPGAALVQTPLNVVNQDNEVDVVFADGDSDGGGRDTALNGQARAYAAFEVGGGAEAVSIAKSSRVVEDGIDPTAVNPKALPGAIVEYCLVVRNNTLLSPARNVVVTDVIPANTTYVPGSIQVGALGGASACVVPGAAEDDDADDGAETDAFRGSFDGGAKRVTAAIPTLLGATSVAASFRAKID